MSARVTKLGRIGIDGLNEYAEQTFADCVLVSRRPSTPTFWFYNLAIDGMTWTWGPSLTDLLSEQSKQLLARVELSEYSTWCTCCDDDLRFGAKIGLGAGGHPAGIIDPRPRVACWPCLFDCHALCTMGCDSTGEIHMPETIIDPRVKAAA